MAALRTGSRVRVRRDEHLYPSKGTWPHFRGRTGTIVNINRDAERPELTEYGVCFGNTRQVDAFFKHCELEKMS